MDVILDRHQVWRSQDPTSVQTFDFCEKKRCHTLFFKKDATFCRLHLFLSHLLKRMNFYNHHIRSIFKSHFISVTWESLLRGSSAPKVIRTTQNLKVTIIELLLNMLLI